MNYIDTYHLIESKSEFQGMKPAMVGMEPVWRVGAITIPTITECVNSPVFF